MTIASRLVLVAGESSGPAPEGKYYIYARDDGVMMRVDDVGEEVIIGRDGSQIPSLGELANVDTTNVEIG